MKFSLRRITLKWKIFAFLLGFCALLLGMLWFFQTTLLTDMYKAIRSKELKEVMKEVEAEIDRVEVVEDFENLFMFLEDIEEEKDIFIVETPVDRVDYFYFDEYGMPRFPEERLRPGLNFNDDDYMTEEEGFTFTDGSKISLTFYARIAPVDATVTTLMRQLAYVTAAMIFLSIILAIVIAKRVSNPIEQITKGAASLAKGDYAVRFNSRGFREIEELSDTLNTAAVELGKVEALRRELLANVSHDMRTPLTLIYSYAEMMNDFPDEITAEQVQVIMDETRRLTSLVNDSLDVSRMESDMVLNKSEFNITKMIDGIVERMSALLNNDGFNITFNYDNPDVIINADELKISRAFYNILLNAVNYSGECRDITVTQEAVGGRVRISVADKGEGIEKSELPLIWDRYYKSGKTHKRAVMGSGLGLSIVKKIVELHGGRYGVDSAVGEGSRFWFEI